MRHRCLVALESRVKKQDYPGIITFYRVRSLEVIKFNFITENQGKLTLFSLKHTHCKPMYCLHWGLVSSMFLFSTNKQTNKNIGAAQWTPSMLCNFRRPEFSVCWLLVFTANTHRTMACLYPEAWVPDLIHYQTLNPRVFSSC